MGCIHGEGSRAAVISRRDTITPNPISFEIVGTAVKAGEPAVTVSGTSISMGVSDDLIIVGSASTTSPPAAVFTVSAQRFTADGANLIGSSLIVTADGPAAVVAGTKLSLDLSGVLIVGDATTTLAELSPHSVLIVGGKSFTADGAGLVECGGDASRVSWSVATALTATRVAVVCVSLSSCEALPMAELTQVTTSVLRKRAHRTFNAA